MLVVCVIDRILENEEKTILPLSTLTCHPAPSSRKHACTMLRFQSVNISRSGSTGASTNHLPTMDASSESVGRSKTDTAPGIFQHHGVAVSLPASFQRRGWNNGLHFGYRVFAAICPMNDAREHLPGSADRDIHIDVLLPVSAKEIDSLRKAYRESFDYLNNKTKKSCLGCSVYHCYYSRFWRCCFGFWHLRWRLLLVVQHLLAFME